MLSLEIRLQLGCRGGPNIPFPQPHPAPQPKPQVPTDTKNYDWPELTGRSQFCGNWLFQDDPKIRCVRIRGHGGFCSDAKEDSGK